MTTTTWPRVAVAAAVFGLLTACGGGGGSSNTSTGGNTGGSTPTNASPCGIWRGTDTISGLQVIGLVDEAGEFHFMRSDEAQYVGTASVSGTSVTSSFDGYAPLGTSFTDGSTHGTGSVSGTVTARTSLSLNSQFKTDSGSSSSGTLDLTFDTLYNRASALATIAGNFTNPQTNVVVTVNSDGSVFSQDPTTGCVLNGTVSIINASYNAYRITFAYASCTGAGAVLNGVQFTGLGTLDNTVTPERAILCVTGTSSGTTYALVFQLNRS